MKKPKTRTVVASVVGAVPDFTGSLWRVRLVAPHLPFFIDSRTLYRSRGEAEAEAEKWKSRKIVIRITR